MVQAAFDNEKYLQTQSAHIRDRIAQFGGKLYLEFGGKLYDDNHASRVLPGFQPDSKLRMLLQLERRRDRLRQCHSFKRCLMIAFSASIAGESSDRSSTRGM